MSIGAYAYYWLTASRPLLFSEVRDTFTMAENKTKPTAVAAKDFLATVQHDRRRTDGETLLALMQQITGEQPVIWGPSMVGFGSYHYRYASGREGNALAVGFSPRSANLALYGLTYAPGAADLLKKLGKHKTGAACLYINKLDDVDFSVLERLINLGYRFMTTEGNFDTRLQGTSESQYRPCPDKRDPRPRRESLFQAAEISRLQRSDQ